MSVAPTTGRPTANVADWLRPRLRRIAVPSWLMSGVLHWGLFVAAISLSELPGCQPDMAGEGGESLREVGIYLRPAFVPDPEDGEPEQAEDAIEQPRSLTSPSRPPPRRRFRTGPRSTCTSPRSMRPR
jgi:hypothetical protein